MRWYEISGDPNSLACKSYRRNQLERAWSVEPRGRFEVIAGMCAGKSVVDLGCVNHQINSLTDPRWLHPHIVASAKICVGVDVDRVGIEAMRNAGFDVLLADVTSAGEGLAELERRGPFEVVLAGEIIEHVDSPRSLFDLGLRLLVPGGALIVTTPNPYAPWRVRSGQLKTVWENVDHVSYFFPSGVAELADRSGLILTTATTVNSDSLLSISRSVKDTVRAVLQWMGGARGVPGLQSGGRLRLPFDPAYLSPLDALTTRLRGSTQMGETSLYVLTKPSEVANDRSPCDATS